MSTAEWEKRQLCSYGCAQYGRQKLSVPPTKFASIIQSCYPRPYMPAKPENKQQESKKYLMPSTSGAYAGTLRITYRNRINNEEIFHRVGTRRLQDIATERRMQLAGRVLRLQNYRHPKVTIT